MFCFIENIAGFPYYTMYIPNVVLPLRPSDALFQEVHNHIITYEHICDFDATYFAYLLQPPFRNLRQPFYLRKNSGKIKASQNHQATYMVLAILQQRRQQSTHIVEAIVVVGTFLKPCYFELDPNPLSRPKSPSNCR